MEGPWKLIHDELWKYDQGSNDGVQEALTALASLYSRTTRTEQDFARLKQAVRLHECPGVIALDQEEN